MWERHLEAVRRALRTRQVAWEVKMFCFKIRKWSEWNSGTLPRHLLPALERWKLLIPDVLLWEKIQKQNNAWNSRPPNKHALSCQKCMHSHYRKEGFQLGLAECSIVSLYQNNFLLQDIFLLRCHFLWLFLFNWCGLNILSLSLSLYFSIYIYIFFNFLFNVFV